MNSSKLIFNKTPLETFLQAKYKGIMHSYAFYVRYCNKNILSLQLLCQQLIFHLLFRYNEAANKKQIKKTKHKCEKQKILHNRTCTV